MIVINSAVLPVTQVTTLFRELTYVLIGAQLATPKTVEVTHVLVPVDSRSAGTSTSTRQTGLQGTITYVEV